MFAATVLIVWGSFVATASADGGGDDCGIGGCGSTAGDGASVGLSRAQTSALPKTAKGEVGSGKKKKTKTVPLQYRTLQACPANTNPDGDSVSCTKAVSACDGVQDAQGPLSRIFFRTVLGDDRYGSWQGGAETCWPELVPNNASKPQLTLAMVQREFRQTPFAKPGVQMQPVGNRTLVNLPTYFRTVFPGEGFGPDEVRTVTILGNTVRIKPVLKSNTYVFGDGASEGPTSSLGGTWPDGDVQHTYRKRGTVTTRITTVYGGQFSVNGGEFQDLPGTATLTGPAQQLQVVEAKTRLVR